MPSASSRAPTRRRWSSATAPSTGCWWTASRWSTAGRTARSPARRRGCSTSTTPDNNDWLAVNQFTVAEGQHTRRPDVVLFVNGLPLAVIELKNPADENADVWTAFQQLQTYQAQIPSLFATNAALVASDGVQARIGALGAGKEWFKPWRTIAGREDAAPACPSCRWCWRACSRSAASSTCCATSSCSRTSGGGQLVKKMAGYHQFHAVNVAVEETLRAARRATHEARPPGLSGWYEAGRRGRAASRATGASAWSGTRRARARA